MTIWFAQNSTVNIDSANQWNDVANGSGNFLTFADLDPADILVANAKTAITINVSFTCTRITTSNANGGTAGGGFTLAAGVTVTADVVAGTTACVTRSAAGDESFIVGNVTGGSATNTYGANNNSTGTVTITGDVTGGSGSNAWGANNASTGTLTITGDVTGGSGNQAIGANNNSPGTLTITGNVTGGSGSTSFGANNASTGTLTITGNVTGGSGSTSFGVRNNSTGTVTISGSITAGSGAGAAGLVSFSGLCLLSGETFTADASGNVPIAASRVLIKSTGTIEQSYRVNNAGIPGIARSLFTGGTNLGQPVIADVRFGTTFGASSEYEGTLRVPDPAYVSLGVLTDNTVGSLTAGLDESALHDALDSYTNKDNWKATGFPTVAEFEARTLPNADYFVVGDFTEPPTVAEIQSGLATEAKQDTAKTAIDAILVDTDATIPATLVSMSGATFDTGTDSLEAIRNRGDAAWAGGGASVNVLPAVGIVADRSPGATISPVVGETISQSITLYQTDGTTPVDLSGKTLAIVFETMAGVDVAVVASGNITISGDDDNTVTFAYPSAVTASERTLRFAIKDAAAPLTEYLKGLCNVTSGPRVDV